MTIVTLYVDDLVLAASNMTLINDFKDVIKGQYKMKDLGELRWVLGMEVRRDRKKRTLEIVQTSYIKQMLERFGMADCNPVATPAEPNVHLTRLDPSKHKPDEWYRSLVGALLYAAMVTRPDIAYAVQMLGRHLMASGEEHRTAAKRVLRYLKGTMDQGIVYGRRTDGNIRLVGYSDADWAGDRATRRSTTGYVFVLAGGAICWASRLQPTVALSTAEAEYMAACSATQEALFQRQLLSDLDFPQKQPTTIYEDNTAAIALTENPVFHQRTKHIDIRYHFVRERVEMGDVKLVHITSEEQLADLLTKALSKPKVEKFRERVLGYSG
jgi:hypothetical protein